MKNLIVYYSYEGNTEELVKGMQEVIDVSNKNWKKQKNINPFFLKIKICP